MSKNKTATNEEEVAALS